MSYHLKMSTFYYPIIRTIDFGSDKLLIPKHDSQANFTIADLDLDYREYEWQWMGTVHVQAENPEDTKKCSEIHEK